MPNDKKTRDFVKADLKKARDNTKTARNDVKDSVKAVKKAGAYTPEFKAVMKGKK